MRAQTPAASAPEMLEFTGRPSWLAWFLAVVPGLIILQSAYVLMVKPVPWPLTILLVGVIVSCGVLAAKALDGAMPGGVSVSTQGLEVSSLLGGQSYSWSEIEDIRLVPAPGTMADDPTRSYANRIGIGLFLKANAKDREDPNVADVVLFVGTDDDTAQFLVLMERLNAHRVRPVAARGPVRLGQRRAPVARAGQEFRRKAAEG